MANNGKIVIDLNGTDEFAVCWFQQMIEDEIDDVNGSIANNELWLKGTDNEEEQMMYAGNIESYKEYKSRLEDVLKQMETLGL